MNLQERAARRTIPTSRHGARPAPSRKQPPMKAGSLLALAAGGLAAASLAGLAVGGRRSPPPRAARYAAYGAALLAASVLADSAMEHYRGNYKKQAMKVAPFAAALTLITALAASTSRSAGLLKTTIFGGAMATGLFGLGFHMKNILRRPGGLSFNNLFYRAPFGAPGALVLAGAAGVGAIKATEAAKSPGGRARAGTLMGGVTALGLFGLTAEIGLLHFRGAFHDKLMYAPVATVPLTGLAVTAATASGAPGVTAFARNALLTTMGLGIVGTGLHAYGVSRNMGGFRNWTQNLFQGPPIAAPPSLLGIGLMGLSALSLLDPKKGDPRNA